jgi:hypothetical protein
MTTINQPWSPVAEVICDFGWYATSGEAAFPFGGYFVNGQTYPPYSGAPYNTDPRYMIISTPVNASITFDAGTSVVQGLGLPYSIVPPGVSIVSYSWDLGNGALTTGPTAITSYNIAVTAPDVSVTLAIVDSLGRRSSTTHVLNLQPSSPIYPSGSEIRQGADRPYP